MVGLLLLTFFFWEAFYGALYINRRNGISIISGDNIHLKNIRIENTRGTWPMSAMDIEPNSYNDDIIGKILIENIVSYNSPRGLSIVLSNYLSDQASFIDIHISNFKSNKDEIGIKNNPFIKEHNTGEQLVELPRRKTFTHLSIHLSRRPILVQGEKINIIWRQNLYFRTSL